MSRKRIDFKDPDVLMILVKMSEGNPGGATALAQCASRIDSYGEVIRFIEKLDEANIRGTQIWVGFRDVCHGDPDEFIRRVNDRDPELVDRINEECVYEGFTEVASWPPT